MKAATPNRASEIERSIVEAATRWYSANLARRAAGSAKRKAVDAARGRYWPAPEPEAARRADEALARARKTEQAARRELARACAQLPRHVVLKAEQAQRAAGALTYLEVVQ